MADSGDILTVTAAAKRLELHPKTVLRFIKEGRLKAARIGKSYRIRRADVDAFAGVPAPAPTAAEAATVTCVLDLPGVGPELAKKWATVVPSALNTRSTESTGYMRADVIYDPERSHLKVVVIGPPADAIPLLRVMQVWIEQLTDR